MLGLLAKSHPQFSLQINLRLRRLLSRDYCYCLHRQEDCAQAQEMTSQLLKHLTEMNVIHVSPFKIYILCCVLHRARRAEVHIDVGQRNSFVFIYISHYHIHKQQNLLLYIDAKYYSMMYGLLC